MLSEQFVVIDSSVLVYESCRGICGSAQCRGLCIHYFCLSPKVRTKTVVGIRKAILSYGTVVLIVLMVLLILLSVSISDTFQYTIQSSSTVMQ